MARKAGVITINLSAGTAKFMADMDAAGAKVKEFGHHSVSEAKATTAAMKALEGNFFNNKKAADKFLETMLGMGPIMQAAFPLVGGIAFAGMLGEVGNKLYEFYKNVREAPEKIEGSFRVLNAPLRLMNDELAVANDRLANDIAKLEGHHQNTLKLALDEAKMAADRLADSLDKDLSSLHKLLKESETGFWKSLATGTPMTKDLAKEIGGESGFGGFRGKVAEITMEGNDRIREASTLKEKEAAETERNTKLLKAYADELIRVDKLLADAHEEAKVKLMYTVQGTVAVPGRDERQRIEMLEGMRQNLKYEQSAIGMLSTNAELSAKKEDLQAARANKMQDKPFEDRMKALGAQIDGVKAKLEAIGKPEAAQIIAKAFGEAQKAITETNKALELHNTALTDGQKTQIRAAEMTLVSAEAEAEWRTKLASTTTSVESRIRSQELLTAAIGKGYEATRSANVETRTMLELGQHFNDPAWMTAHSADVAGLRGGFGREFDAQHAQQAAAAVDRLQEQVELERELAAAQAEGAEAVRQAGLAVRLRQMAEAGATKDQIAAEMELFNAQRGNAFAGDIAKIDERIRATQRLTAAIRGGAEAERQAALENKYSDMRRGGDVTAPGVIGMGQKEIAERTADAADHQARVTAEALRTGMAYQNQLESIAQQVAALEKIKAAQGDSLAIEISLRELENQRLKVLVEESLQLGRARDGVRAFFIEMQADGKKTAAIVYEALNSALDRTSANLAKLLTGQKTEWANAFREIGQQMLESEIKSQMQKGLAALGKKFGIDLGSTKPDGTFGNPIWVQVKGSGGLSPAGTPAGAGGGLDRGGLFGGGSKGGGIFSFFGKLFGHGAGGGDTPDVSSSISFPEDMDMFGGAMAGGGGVDPGHVYRVGEEGEEWFVPSTRGRIVPNRELGGGGHTITYQIDARGADLGAHNRIARGIEASHRSAVATAVQAQHERGRRVPGK